MNRIFTCVLAMSTIVATALPARANDDADNKVSKATAETAVEELAKAASEACDAKITATIDWESFTDPGWTKYSIGSYCGGPLGALPKLCVGANTKKYIKSKVKAFRCRYAGKGKRNFTISKGTMQLDIDFDVSDSKDFALRSLMGKL